MHKKEIFMFSVRGFSKLMLVYLFWIASWVLAGSLFEVYFYGLGLTMQEIVATSFFWFIGSLLVMPLFKKIDSKKFMIIGILLSMLGAVVLYFFDFKEMGYIYKFLVSVPQFFFWIPFNVIFYEFKKDNAAQLGAIYYSVTPFLSLILPGFGGAIAATLGYGSLFIMAIVCYLITLVLAVFLLDNKIYKYDTAQSIKSISGLKTLVFLEGFAAAMIVQVFLETMLLKYADKPLEYGGFISLVTLFAIIASLLTARFSDVQKRRREFIILSAMAFGAAAILTSFSTDIAHFFVGFAMINFFRTIFFPLPLAVIVDNSKNLVETMVGREFMLNVGRIFGSVVAFVLMFYFDISFVLLLFGTIMMVGYPLAFELKKRKLGKI